MSNDSVYVSGYFYDSSFIFFNADGKQAETLYNKAAINNPQLHAFVAKYDSTGNFKWAVQMGGDSESYDKGYAVCTDLNDNIYVAGKFSDLSFNIYNANGALAKTLTNTTGLNNDSSNAFIIKYNNLGTFLWAIKLGGTTTDEANTLYKIFTDSNHNIYATGYFGVLNFNIYDANDNIVKTLIGDNILNSAFIVKYDSAGNFKWATKMSLDSESSGVGAAGEALSIDLHNNVYVTGTFSDISLNIYNSNNPNGDYVATINGVGSDISYNGFLIKYDSNGNYLWGSQIGGKDSNAYTQSSGCCTDFNNNVYLTGLFHDLSCNIYNANTNPANNSPAKILQKTSGILDPENFDAFVAKYDASGRVKWATKIGGTQNPHAASFSICSDLKNCVYLTGYFSELSLNIYDAHGNIKKTLTNTSGTGNPEYSDAFISKYDSHGNFKWAAQMGGKTPFDQGISVSTDINHNVYVSGSFSDLSFNIYNADGSIGYKLSNTIGVDGFDVEVLNTFLIKYNSNGYVQWAAKMGGTESNVASSIGLGIACTKYLPPMPISNICFPANTFIKTDQGHIAIENIDVNIHTINNKNIKSVPKTISQDKYLVCFEKNSLGNNYPNKQTIMTKDHKILFQGKMIEAWKFVCNFKGVNKKEYNGEILYNILMEDYDKMNVHNMICETLHPKNIIAKLATSAFSDDYKNDLIVMMNDSIKKNDKASYKKLISHI